MAQNALQNGAIISLLALVIINLFTLHYILNQNSVPPNTDPLRPYVPPPAPTTTPTPSHQKIPRIVHLSWKNDKIPRETVQWVKRWKETNPNWQVWFWTDNSAKRFISVKFSHLLPIYNKYRTAIFRADAMRYLILYEFGGVWADLDVEPLKSLDPLRDKYSCILSQESEVHAKSGWRIPQMACNAFMATRPHHPFFRFLVDMLEVNQKDNHPVAATGPVMLTRMYQAYRPLYEDLGAGKLANKVHLASVNMFLPTVDILALDSLRTRCDKNTLPKEHIYLCAKYLNPDFKNGPTNESYTDHHWWHSWFGKHKFEYTPIVTILPDVIFPEKTGLF